MASEIEIETEESQKTQITTQEVITWFLLCSHSDSNLKTVKERSRSRLQSVHKFQRKRKCNEFSQ